MGLKQLEGIIQNYGSITVVVLTLSILYHIKLTPACYVFPPEMPDPCLDKECPFGARCVASMDGRTAQCECPSKCPNYGDHTGSRAVCGSDGKDYRNLCELRRSACQQNMKITVKFQGKCGK